MKPFTKPDLAWALPGKPLSTQPLSAHVREARGLLDGDPVPPSADGNSLLRDADNPLIPAAAPLMGLIVRIRQRDKVRDVTALKRRFDKGLLRFTRSLLQAGLKPLDVGCARYMLCAAADEAVMATTWGANSDWSSSTLLSRFHDDVLGGVRFFEHLQRCERDPHQHLWLLELMYLCLISGFKGRYGQHDSNVEALYALHKQLYRTLSQIRGEQTRRVSPGTLPEVQAPRRALPTLPVWPLVSAVAMALGMLFAAFDHTLDTVRAAALEHFTATPRQEGQP